MKGQASIEYAMIIGILLLVTIPIFYYALSQSQENTRLNHAYDSVNAIANVADSVYALGPGSKRSVWVSMPKGILSTSVGNGTIKIVLSALGTDAEYVAFTSANVTGILPNSQGRYKVRIEMLDSGLVQIG